MIGPSDATHRRKLEDRLDPLREAYFESDRDRECMALLDRALQRADEIDRRRAKGTLKIVEGCAEIILGPSGTGKTTMINRATRLHPRFAGYAPGAYPATNKCPWSIPVTIRAPSTTAHFGIDLLRAMGYPILPKRPDARIILPLVRDHLRAHGVKVIMVDEVHALTRSKNATELAKIQDFFRSLLNDYDHPVQLIFIGTEAALPGLNDEDGQLLRRANILRLSAFTDADTTRAAKIIRKLAHEAGIEIHEPRPDLLASRLIHAERGRIGLMVETTVFAIEEAMKSGDGLSGEHYARVFARRKGVPTSLNPYLVDDFRNIEIKDLFEIVSDAPPRGRPRNRGGKRS